MRTTFFQRMNQAFGLAILGGVVGARHPKMNPTAEEELAGVGVVKLGAVVIRKVYT